MKKKLHEFPKNIVHQGKHAFILLFHKQFQSKSEPGEECIFPISLMFKVLKSLVKWQIPQGNLGKLQVENTVRGIVPQREQTAFQLRGMKTVSGPKSEMNTSVACIIQKQHSFCQPTVSFHFTRLGIHHFNKRFWGYRGNTTSRNHKQASFLFHMIEAFGYQQGN